ncbi:hypothetical protein AGMMS49992_11810 [Clostridia bacterium]|nr:hypothetical protein AGMMS49992_11810 [Clostridia bacterium]
MPSSIETNKHQFTPLEITPADFLQPFFASDERVCLRVFDDRKPTIFKGMKLESSVANMPAMMETLHKHNQQHRGVYFVVNYGGHEDSEIKRINAQFVECDDLTFEEQQAQIDAFPLPPSIVVKTAKSLHVYWLMRDAKVCDFRRIQKKLVAQFHGDPVCVNESRVLRLPGFYHCKGDAVPVNCIRFDPQLRYTQAELEAVLSLLPDDPSGSSAPVTKAESSQTKPKKSPRTALQKGIQLVAMRCAFIKHCRDDAASLRELDWYAMISNLAVFDGGEQAIHELSRLYPKYSRAETQEKIAHFMASGTNPMTCVKIAEGGFICPKMTDGSCDCKSPAALCYKPLDLDSMRTLLAGRPVTNNVSDNLVTALGFIQEYLANVDAVTATAFISNELRERFALKALDTKPLITAHRELLKEHKDKQAAANVPHDDIPAWYSPTEHGGFKFLPDVLAEHMAKSVYAFTSTGMFFAYEKGVYVMQNELWATAVTKSFMMRGYVTLNMVKDAIGQWKSLIQRPVADINAEPFIINVRNGLLNIVDGSFAEHTANYLTTVQLSAAYDPNATCPQFLAFMDSMLSPDDVALVQEIVGYLLIPLNKAQKSFILVGAPNAGKSTLLSVVQEVLLGCENVSNVAWQNLSDRFNKAELFGKLANIFADLPSKSLDDGGMFKALTGEDFITAEWKHEKPFHFRPYARLLFSCNDIPRNYGDRTEGFYRRLLILRFNKSVAAEQRDPNLRDKLADERNGILIWALAGLRRLMTQNYQFSETDTTRNELQKYKIECNSVLSFFEECCKLDVEAECPREDVFNTYREYCKKNGFQAMSQIRFNKEVEAAYPIIERAKDKLGNRRTWRGLCCQDE